MADLIHFDRTTLSNCECFDEKKLTRLGFASAFTLPVSTAAHADADGSTFCIVGAAGRVAALVTQT